MNTLTHTFSLHAHGQALLVAAVLAAVALALVHHAVLVIAAGVAQVFPHCALEEAFAALAAVHAIVLTWKETGQERRKRRWRWTDTLGGERKEEKPKRRIENIERERHEENKIIINNC